jgi:hypothetical protein
MAWMEGKLQPIDLLGALQLKMRGDRGGREDNGQNRSQQRMAVLLAGEQLKAAKLANQKTEMDFNASPTITVKGIGYDPRTGMGAHKEFLNDMPGYISGVSPETVFAEQGANTRALMGAMASGGGGGRGRGGEDQKTDPNAEDNSPAYSGGYLKDRGQVAAESLAKQKIESGLSGKIAQANADIEAAKLKANADMYGTGYDELNKIAQNNARAGGEVIAAGDKKVAEAQKLAEKNVGGLNSVRQNLYKNNIYQGLSAEKKQEIKDKISKIYAAMNGDVDIEDVVNYYKNK